MLKRAKPGQTPFQKQVPRVPIFNVRDKDYPKWEPFARGLSERLNAIEGFAAASEEDWVAWLEGALQSTVADWIGNTNFKGVRSTAAVFLSHKNTIIGRVVEAVQESFSRMQELNARVRLRDEMVAKFGEEAVERANRSWLNQHGLGGQYDDMFITGGYKDRRDSKGYLMDGEEKVPPESPEKIRGRVAHAAEQIREDARLTAERGKRIESLGAAWSELYTSKYGKAPNLDGDLKDLCAVLNYSDEQILGATKAYLWDSQFYQRHSLSHLVNNFPRFLRAAEKQAAEDPDEL